MTDESAQKENQIYINGKQQAVDLLRFLPSSERTKLLKGIKGRNVTLYRELMELCFDFSQLSDWPDEALAQVLKWARPALIGIALKGEDRNFQRRSLSLMPREKAEKAWDFLTRDLSVSQQDLDRAKSNLGQYALSLLQAGRVEI